MVVNSVKLVILISSFTSFVSTFENSIETKQAEDQYQVTNRLGISIITRDESQSKSFEDVFENLIENGIESNGKICYKKVMLQEYTDYTEVMTCNHKTQKRCHTSYITKYEPHQEQRCNEKFKKSCTIRFEDVTHNEDIEVCKTYLCPDCSREGPQECRAVYDTVCESKRKMHNVLDDVVTCNTVYEEGEGGR